MKRPRFSLRSLLLLTLTLAAAGVVWVQRAPWAPIYRVNEMAGKDLHYADRDEHGVIHCTGFDGMTLEIHPEEQRCGEVSMRPRRIAPSDIQQLMLETDATEAVKRPLRILVAAEGGTGAVLSTPAGTLYTWNKKDHFELPFRLKQLQTFYFAPRTRFAVAQVISEGEWLVDFDTGTVRKLPPLYGYYMKYGFDVSPDATRMVDHAGHSGSEKQRVIHIASGESFVFPVNHPIRVRIAGPSHLVVGDGGGLTIWKRRRDENLWGFTQRPEAWLAAIFLFAFLYSVIRDRRVLSGAKIEREIPPASANMV